MGYTVFFESKVDGKMIFTDYWKVLVLNFSEMGNTVFFSAKKLMERSYSLGLFELSMIFQDLGNMVFCAVLSSAVTGCVWASVSLVRISIGILSSAIVLKFVQLLQ